MIQQKFYKSLSFWTVVITSVSALAVRIASGATLVEIITQLGVTIIAILGAANNPTNPDGFGANTIKE